MSTEPDKPDEVEITFSVPGLYVKATMSREKAERLMQLILGAIQLKTNSSDAPPVTATKSPAE